MKKIDTACIIDDDSIFIFGAKKMMQLTNFSSSCLFYRDGKEALDKLTAINLSDEELPDVILLDLNMPVMDGWQFLDEFVKIPKKKQIVIYIVTSSVDPEDFDRIKSYDIVRNYIIKPLSPDKFREILNDFQNQAVICKKNRLPLN